MLLPHQQDRQWYQIRRISWLGQPTLITKGYTSERQHLKLLKMVTSFQAPNYQTCQDWCMNTGSYAHWYQFIASTGECSCGTFTFPAPWLGHDNVFSIENMNTETSFWRDNNSEWGISDASVSHCVTFAALRESSRAAGCFHTPFPFHPMCWDVNISKV